jgi:Domain of unknown function (DUF4340)
MFPGLADKLRNAAKLEITHQGKQTVIEKRPDGTWGIAALHDYPAQESKLRGVLTGLTELRLTEPRTSDPAEYTRLAVDDPSGAKSEADLVRVVDAEGKPIAAVIIGHRRVRGRPNVPDEVYVRRPDEAQSWLAEGSVRADADAMQWLDRDVMDIKADRIASVVVGDKALVFGRVDGKFTLTEPAEHPKLDDYKIDGVARGLEALTIQAVKPDAEVTGEPAGHAVFTTTDGLVVTVTLLHADKEAWARFAVSGPEKVKAEADRLAGRLNGWSYEIGAWKEKSLVPAMDDLKAPEPPAAPQASKPVMPVAPSAAEEQKAPPTSEPGAAAAPASGAGSSASSANEAGKAASPAPRAGGTDAAPAEGGKATSPASEAGKSASEGDRKEADPADAGRTAAPAPGTDKPAAAGAENQEAPASAPEQK